MPQHRAFSMSLEKDDTNGTETIKVIVAESFNFISSMRILDVIVSKGNDAERSSRFGQ